MNDPGLRFLIDVSAGGGIEKYLREKGYDTKAVRDIDPRMEDEDIIRIAVSEGRMEFSEIRALKKTKMSKSKRVVRNEKTEKAEHPQAEISFRNHVTEGAKLSENRKSSQK